jgi:hypothetical protein
LALAVWVPVAAEVLSIQPLPLAGWGLVVAFSVLPLLVVQVTKMLLALRRRMAER